MPLIAYLIAIIVAVGGVAIELELLINSPPPQPAARTAAVHVGSPARGARKAEPAVSQPAPDKTTADLSPNYPANPGGGLPQADTPSPGLTSVANAAPAMATSGPATERPPAEQTAPVSAVAAAKDKPASTEQPADQSASNRCDVRACAATYSSFRASDCTYQPFGGDRRLCPKGAQLSEASEPPEPAPREVRRSLDARAEAQCDVKSCASRYSSFRAADCTYQPFDGGARRLCER
jgi:hypothetical protein